MSAGWPLGTRALGGMLGMANSIFIVPAATTVGSALLYDREFMSTRANAPRPRPAA
jgi:hypothetical protein